MELISRQNPKVKLARALSQAKTRRESGLFLVEGLHHLGELAESDFEIKFVLHSPGSLVGEFGSGLIDRFATRSVPVFASSKEILDDLSGKSESTGAVAVARQKEMRFNELQPARLPAATEPANPHLSASRLHVALVAPQDPGNIGSILRTMDAAGAGALILLDGGADPWQPAAVRASMGAIFWHPLVRASFDEFTDWAKVNAIRVIGSSAHAAEDYRVLAGYMQPVALLFGSERTGLTPTQAAACDVLVRIPMQGRGTSLNLAMAAGIILFEIVRDGSWEIR